MNARLFATTILFGPLVLACDSSTALEGAGGAGGAATVGTGGHGGTSGLGAAGGVPGATTGVALASLSLLEAPAATRTFFWGTVDLTAPGFVGPPRDELTIGLGPDNGLRYLSWKTLPMLPKTFGDGAHDFPLSGSRAVDLSPDIPDDYTATVLDGPAPTPDHFLLRERVVVAAGLCDYVESTEGVRSGAGWSVVYSQEGKLWGASISAHGQGMLFAGDPKASPPTAGQPTLWSAPVELTAPGFYGPPLDHLTVALDGSGQVRWFTFDRFVRQLRFTDTADALAPSGTLLANEGAVTYDDVVPASPSHVVVRYQVRSTERQNDYTEGLDCTRQGDALVVRYFIAGKLWGATIDAHAAGTLVPASPSATGAGGAGGAGGIPGSGGGGGMQGGSSG